MKCLVARHNGVGIHQPLEYGIVRTKTIELADISTLELKTKKSEHSYSMIGDPYPYPYAVLILI